MGLRIAVLTTSYPGYPGDPAGHFVEAECRQYARSGAEVHVLAPGERLHECGDARLTVWPLGGSGLFGHPGALERLRVRSTRIVEFLPFAVRALARLGALGRVDRVVAHFVVPSGWPLASLGRRRGHAGEIEVVAHGSDVLLLGGFPPRVRQAVVQSLVGAGVRFRFVSESLRQSMISSLPAGLSDTVERTSRVELPALDIPAPLLALGAEGGLSARDAAYARTWIQSRACARPEGGHPTLLWATACRLIASKRVDLALRLAATQGATLWVIGDGPEREALERLSLDLRADVHFFGQLPRPATLALVASADRLIHLSESEGAPTIVREARALGVPVLARPVGDLRSWADHDAGIQLMETTPPTRPILE